jgi:hypothetical protein
MFSLERGAGLLFLGCLLAGCVSYTPVPLRGGALPDGAVEVGDTVRVRERSGATTEFEVTSIESGALVGAGQRAELADISYVGIASRKRAALFALGIVGGAWLLYEQNDGCDPGPGPLTCL